MSSSSAESVVKTKWSYGLLVESVIGKNSWTNLFRWFAPKLVVFSEHAEKGMTEADGRPPKTVFSWLSAGSRTFPLSFVKKAPTVMASPFAASKSRQDSSSLFLTMDETWCSTSAFHILNWPFGALLNRAIRQLDSDLSGFWGYIASVWQGKRMMLCKTLSEKMQYTVKISSDRVCLIQWNWEKLACVLYGET